MRQVKRVLRDDGTVWVNLGDSYATGAGKVGNFPGGGDQGKRWRDPTLGYRGAHGADPKAAAKGPLIQPNRLPIVGLKPKDLIGIPWRVAFALQADGWYLRSAIPWLKRNGMPGSEKDRPTTSIEYVFLLSKSRRYFYDYKSIQLPVSPDTHARYARGRSDHHKWADGGPGDQTIARTLEHMRKPCGWHQSENYKGQHPSKPGITPKSQPAGSGIRANDSFQSAVKDVLKNRMRRVSDWFFESFQGLLSNEEGDPLAFVVNSQGFKGAHFATFPEKLVEPCIKAGCPIGGIVLDPFVGSGTTARVATKLNRKAVGIDLTYQDLAKVRISKVQRELVGVFL